MLNKSPPIPKPSRNRRVYEFLPYSHLKRALDTATYIQALSCVILTYLLNYLLHGAEPFLRS